MAELFIDFNYVKSNADVAAVLEALGLEGRRSGTEIRIRCVQPDHEDNRSSCDVNAEKRTFFCHSCNAKGTILDLVAAFRGCDTRAAAQEVAEICGIPLSDRPKARAGDQKPGRMKPGIRNADPCPSEADDAVPDEKTTFTPFTTVLKLDPCHAFGAERSIDPAVIEEFEMGFQDRGMFKGRWCIPIHDREGNQLGYIGRWTGKRCPDDVERWLLPKGFPKKAVLFNAHRASLTDRAVIVVEGPLDAVRLHALGLSVVALMGTSISDAQIELLSEMEVCQVLLMMDGDAPGRKAVPELLARLGRWFYVRDVKLPDGEDPETIGEDFLEERVWWL